MGQDAKVVVPLQSFGAGDVIFVQSLMNKFIEAGYKVIFPVEKHFVDGFNPAYPNVTFVPKELVNIDWNSKKDYEKDGVRYLPIRFAEQILGLPYKDVMRAKYTLYGFDWNIWRNTMYERDGFKEKQLYDLVGAKQPYNLVSKYYGSNSQFKADIKIDNDYPIIEMKTIQGYSIFDWSLVIQAATEVHAVSSSILYMLELLELRANEIHLYGRMSIEPTTWRQNIEYLCTKPYIFHDR